MVSYYYDTQHQIPPLLSKIHLSPYTISTMPHKPCHVFNLHYIPYLAPIRTISKNCKTIRLWRASKTRIIFADISICFLFAVNVKVNYWGQMKILRWTVSKLLLIAFGFGKVLLFFLIWTFAKVSAIKYFCTTHDFETAAQGKRVLT